MLLLPVNAGAPSGSAGRGAVRQGYRTRHRASGSAEAREQLRLGTPTLVLLDLRLGDGNGVDLAEDIRADPTRRDLPILVLGADAMPEDAGNSGSPPAA